MLPYILAVVGGYLIGDSLKGKPIKFALGGKMANGGRIKVGTFSEEQLKNKEDKKAVEKAQKESGLTYVDTKIIKKGGKMYLDVYLIPNEEYYNSSKFAKGGKAESESIRKHYINSYPTDELGSEINPKATFDGLYKVLEKGKDAYAYIGVGDSIVRERVFEKLADLKGVDYEVIYTMWLSDGGYMAKGGDVGSMEDNIKKIDMGGYKIVIKKTNSPSNYNVFASLFKKGEKMPLLGTTFAENTSKEEIKEWFEKRIKMLEKGIYAYGGRPAKNYRTLLNEFEKEKPSIAIGLISDDVATGMMRDKFSQSVQWEKLSDEEKKKYNEDYRNNLIEFRNFILKEFIKKYYSDQKVKERCKGESRSTIEAIKKEMTKIAETYPKKKY